MFEEDVAALSTVDLLESAAELRALVNRAEARLLEHAQVFADRNHPGALPRRHGAGDGRERSIVLGGEGCPAIAEFAPAEFGLVLGMSVGAAAAYLGEALALRHRFPQIWDKVQAGEATPWRARKIAAACQDLGEDAAAVIDQRLAWVVDAVTPLRLERIVQAAEAHAAPEVARAKAEQNARERGVYVGRSDEYGSKKVFIRAPSGHVIRFNATVASIADALKLLGDTRPLQARRAEAIGIISDPRYTEELLLRARQQFSDAQLAEEQVPGQRSGGASEASAGASIAPAVDVQADRDAPHPSEFDVLDPLGLPYTDPVEPFDPRLSDVDEDEPPMDAAARRALHARLALIKRDAYRRRDDRGAALSTGVTDAGLDAGRPTGRLRPRGTVIYVHLTDQTLSTGEGVLRAEGIGPLLADQLTELIGYGPYDVKPVIDLKEAICVDAYEIPDHLRERVKLTYPVEVFPYGNRQSTDTVDLDHIRPYDPSGPPGQTSTTNLAPLSRFSHRVKTHAHGWDVRRADATIIEWTTPHGFTFHVTPDGTARVRRRE